MNKKIAFIYPGQGAQSIGMCKDFWETYNLAKEIIQQANNILKLEISKIMFEGPEQELKKSKNAQVAILIHSIVIDSLLRQQNIVPSYVAGHSLGEYTALISAKAISVEDGIKVVRLRGEMMSEAGYRNPGKMAAIIGLDKIQVENICAEVANTGGIVTVANYNTATQIVISGEPEAVNKACAVATKIGAKRVVVLPVSGAFHSPLMKPAQEQFEKILDSTNIKDAEIPIIANTTAEPISKKDEILQELKQQILSPVKWYETIKKMIEYGVEIFIEVGPGKILKGLLLEIDRNLKVYSTYNVVSFQNVINLVK